MYTIWRAEVAHFKAQHLPYRKTGTEWEILGELAERLYHPEEAKDAFQRALDLKFSAKAWARLLEMYVDEGDVQRALNAAIRLSVFRRRWYDEQTHPTVVSKALFKLIRTHGLAKVSYTLVSVRSVPSISLSPSLSMLRGASSLLEGVWRTSPRRHLRCLAHETRALLVARLEKPFRTRC